MKIGYYLVRYFVLLWFCIFKITTYFVDLMILFFVATDRVCFKWSMKIKLYMVSDTQPQEKTYWDLAMFNQFA